ncbi:MAG: helix-turn-helix transcriptional regulator [Cyanobacteria bacterium J06581_3]
MDANEFLRKNLPGRSRKDLADESGLCDSTISRFLRGQQKLKSRSLRALSKAAAGFSRVDPQIMMCWLADLYNEAYRKEYPSPTFDPKVYTDVELEKFLNDMLCCRDHCSAVNYNYLKCIKEIKELSMWARQHKLGSDFDLPFMHQADFKSRLNEAVLRAGVEFHLYTLIRDLFTEIRDPLQLVGNVGLRVYLAKWLVAESKRRDEPATSISASSALAWSYTSSTGGYRNLKLAREFSLAADELYEAVRQEISLEPSIAVELHENRVRIATREGKLRDAEEHIQAGLCFVEEIKPSVDCRFHMRFQTTFLYHRGIAQYRGGKYIDAAKTFSNVTYNAKLIGWERVLAGGISWCATVANALRRYEYSLELAEPFIALVFEDCYSFPRQDSVCLSKRTRQILTVAAETYYALGRNEIADSLREKASLILESLS